MQFHWRRGLVEIDTSSTPRIATKKALDKHRHGALQKEADILKKLNEQGITYVPEILERGDGWFSYPRIPGESFDKVFVKQSATNKSRLMHELVDKAYQLDTLGIIHGELDKPMSNVLVNKLLLEQQQACIFIIDFERGYRQDYSGKNLRHVTQWLHRIGIVSRDQCKTFWTYPVDTLYYKLKTMINKNKNTPFLSWFILAVVGSLLLFLLDQLSKRLFYDLSRWASTFFLTPVFNTGVGWSIPIPLWITLLVAWLISGGVLIWMKKHKTFPRRAILLLAWARGNSYDRFVLWWVRDFIDLHYRPVFNFADIYLTVACLLLLLSERVWSPNHSSWIK